MDKWKLHFYPGFKDLYFVLSLCFLFTLFPVENALKQLQELVPISCLGIKRAVRAKASGGVNGAGLGAHQGESHSARSLVKIFLGPGRVLLKTLLEALSLFHYVPLRNAWTLAELLQMILSSDSLPTCGLCGRSQRRIPAEAVLLSLHGTGTPVLLLLLSQSCPRNPLGLHCVWIRLEFELGRNFWDLQLNLCTSLVSLETPGTGW